MKKRPPGILLLEDGRAFRGRLFGGRAKGFGEVVFNTALTGYQEIITDPSYAGQVVTMTATQIGNYGINTEDDEWEKPWLSGFVCRELSGIVSNQRSEKSLHEFLLDHDVPAIDGLDTRALTLHLRKHGAMRGVIAPDGDENALLAEVKASPTMEGQDLVKVVSNRPPWDMTFGYDSEYAETTFLKPSGAPLKCAAIDYGAKKNILRCLVQVGFNVRVFNATSKADEILAWGPDAVFLSNGPGDPAALDYAIAEIKKLIAKRLPIFGICLGHQLLTWAFGGRTYKLKFGHHAANHPVKELATGMVEITSQNHGFATDPASLPDDVEITHMNINDNTVSGIRHKKLPVFSVQYHPEASPGPHDSLHLFRRFRQMADQQSKQPQR
ncbi:MAG: glutamine-hydrolyzing carbamoyl-phosphate synthase small subunit [Planctomycetes bacterium]|nr:glutamine-hydrolyzing carbamoyl-phosphate synthase small subunit [Planctomycetota bacterium]MCW8137245.1 glutamine-hydrolyzing carbamoyl-phosphate synthase small subunit [Planctomycetota bacterium]